MGTGFRWPGRKANLRSYVSSTELMNELLSSCPATRYIPLCRAQANLTSRPILI
jgi:hypothetical protein